MPCKGKSAARRVEEELGGRAKKEGGRALWKEHPKRGTIIRIGMVYPGDNSDIQQVQRMWKKRKLCGG